METDYLSVDPPISGQSHVCLSFVSPENVLKNKEMYLIEHFLKDLNTELKLGYDDIYTKYEDFKYRKEVELNDNFDKQNHFQTSVRGVKIKGVYSTLEEAMAKAKIFQKLDKSFHVFVGSVGHWLPFDSCYKYLDSIEGQNYQEESLNKLIHSYKENELQKEEFFEDRKNEDMKKALIKESDPWMNKIENSNTLEITNITEPLEESSLMTQTTDDNLSSFDLMESPLIEKPSEYTNDGEQVKEL